MQQYTVQNYSIPIRYLNRFADALHENRFDKKSAAQFDREVFTTQCYASAVCAVVLSVHLFVCLCHKPVITQTIRGTLAF